MPVYPVKCLNPECGMLDEVFSRVDDRHMLRCPECGSLCEQDYARKGVGLGAGTRTFTGKQAISRTWAFNTNEVPEAQRLAAQFGSPDLANCIDPSTGDVRFKNRAQAGKFNKAMDGIKKHYAEERAAKKAAKPPDAI